MTYLQTFMVLSLPITGMCYAVLGAVKLPLAERLKLDEAKVGGLIASFGFMVGPIILMSGFLADALGRKGVWLSGTALVALSLFTLSRAQHYRWAVVAVAMLSAGWAAMINVANVLMYLAYTNVFMATNLLDCFFGLGAFLTPIVTVWLIRKGGFSRGVSALGLLTLLPFLMALPVEMQGAPSAKPVGFGVLMGDPVMWLCGLTLLFWVPIESCTAAWATTLVQRLKPAGEDEKRSARIDAWALSAFWFCFMGSRLIAAVIENNSTATAVETVHTARLVHIALAVAMTLTMLGLVFSTRRGLTFGLLVLAGLLAGPFFPNLMALLLTHFPVEVHGRAVGVLFGMASIGWTVIPSIMGAVAKKHSVPRAFLVAAVCGVILLALVVTHHVYAQGVKS
ncbi:MAG TPA: MFS transporter [Verrucomicrobiae bacterium]|jgi:fucose permease